MEEAKNSCLRMRRNSIKNKAEFLQENERGNVMGKKVKPIILILVMACLIGGYYFYLSNKIAPKEEAEIVTAVQDVLLKNLDTNYPPTPREVVKYYSEISKCLYNESYSEEQLEQMADKLLAIYDEELVANNPREEYIKSLKAEVEKFHENSYTISNFTPSLSTDVEEYTVDGRKCAQLYCTYTIRTGSTYSTSQQIFILRKDAESGHWKILDFGIPLQE